MTRQYLISGLVQGVGFRWYTARVARELGVCGFVRNLPDGRVEVVAGGPDGQLAALHAKLATGPAGARVVRIDVADVSDELEASKDFNIR